MITSIGHVAFRVADLDTSVDFYCRGLGLREAFRLQDDDLVRGIYLTVAPGEFIELFPPGTTTVRAAPLESSYRHVCLVVDDLAATLEQLAERGVIPDSEMKKGKRDGNWQAFVSDPDGNKIELMQIDPMSPQAKASR